MNELGSAKDLLSWALQLVVGVCVWLGQRWLADQQRTVAAMKADIDKDLTEVKAHVEKEAERNHERSNRVQTILNQMHLDYVKKDDYWRAQDQILEELKGIKQILMERQA